MIISFRKRHIYYAYVKKSDKCLNPGSNWGPSDLQSDALPTELSRRSMLHCQILYIFKLIYCGDSGSTESRFIGIGIQVTASYVGTYEDPIAESHRKFSVFFQSVQHSRSCTLHASGGTFIIVHLVVPSSSRQCYEPVCTPNNSFFITYIVVSIIV